MATDDASITMNPSRRKMSGRTASTAPRTRVRSRHLHGARASGPNPATNDEHARCRARGAPNDHHARRTSQAVATRPA